MKSLRDSRRYVIGGIELSREEIVHKYLHLVKYVAGRISINLPPNVEINDLHAEAFATRVFDEAKWNWRELVDNHSLGWVVARDGGRLVGFVNVISDGLVHAWIQDTMVDPSDHHHGIGRQLIAEAVTAARATGCEWLHVDLDDDLRTFYFDACGFTPTNAGLIAVQ